MKCSPGFSLVEVTLALGVISFSLVGLMGMLPVGLSGFREAMELQTQSRIRQAIAAEVQLTPYTVIASGAFEARFPRHYDEDGAPAGAAEALYTVVADDPLPVDLPGSPARGELLRLTFGVSKRTAPGVSGTFAVIASDSGH